MMVRKDKLTTFPQAFQEYVNEFFELKRLGEVEYLYAFRVISFDPCHYLSKGKKGIAPCHSVDLLRFREGLHEEQSLLEWIAMSTDQVDIITIYKEWDDGCTAGFCSDD